MTTLIRKQLLELASNIDDRFALYHFVGTMYGYPECCIQLFLDNVSPFWYDNLPWYPARTLKLDGYIPCEKCSKLPRQTLVNII